MAQQQGKGAGAHLLPAPGRQPLGRFPPLPLALEGRYEPQAALGKGSYGEVWRARRLDDDEVVVVKVVWVHGLDERQRASAMNEIRVLTSVSHPNIVRYIEHVLTPEFLFIIMEFADGGDLWQLLHVKKIQLSELQVLGYFVQITLALKHMHDRRILHRDLKPTNVFITGDNHVKLGDFGISTVLRHSRQRARTRCGTPNYYSPEIVQGNPYNNKADVWALGCVTYEMCRMAFDGGNPRELMERIVTARYDPLPASFSTELHSIVGRMLSREQAMRPSLNVILQCHLAELVSMGGNVASIGLPEGGTPMLPDPGPQGDAPDLLERLDQEDVRAARPDPARPPQPPLPPAIPLPPPPRPPPVLPTGGRPVALPMVKGIFAFSEEDYEQEMDRILASVMGRPSPILSRVTSPFHQGPGGAPAPSSNSSGVGGGYGGGYGGVAPDAGLILARAGTPRDNPRDVLCILRELEGVGVDESVEDTTFGDGQRTPSPHPPHAVVEARVRDRPADPFTSPEVGEDVMDDEPPPSTGSGGLGVVKLLDDLSDQVSRFRPKRLTFW